MLGQFSGQPWRMLSAELAGVHIGQARIAHGQHHNGRRIAISLRYAAKGVLRAGAALHGKDANLFARTEARNGVGHVQANALLAHDNRADVHLGRRLNQRVDRVGKEIFNALLFEDVGQLHLPFIGSSGFVGMW
ncbi:MAG: hypothetical protein R2911_23910 [Caldilineaceae bacterium]